jgi:hypothetical protein
MSDQLRRYRLPHTELAGPLDDKRIVAYGIPTDEYERLRTPDSTHHELVRARDSGALLRYLAIGERVAVVLDGTTLGDSEFRRIVEILVSRDVPFVHVFTLSSRTARHVRICAEAGASPTIVMRGFDDLEQGVRKLIAGGRGGAVAALARALPEAWGEGTKTLAVEAAVVGRRVCSVAAWAAARRESARSLDRRVGESPLPTARRLLTWMLFLHTAWRIDVEGWPPKRVAGEAGVASPHELVRRFRRVIPEQVDVTLKHLGFGDACESFLHVIGRTEFRGADR